MKITKAGVSNALELFKGVCPNCQCEFLFEERDFMPGASWVNCPAAGCTYTLHAGKHPPEIRSLSGDALAAARETYLGTR